MNDHENPPLKHNGDEQLRQEIEQRKQCIRSLGDTFRLELSEELQRTYISALLIIPIDHLRKAITIGIWRWKFFPTLAEIREVLDEVKLDVNGHQRAYERLKAAYELAYKEGRNVKGLPSLRDAEGLSPDVVKRLAGEVMTREERIMMGLEEPRPMSSEEMLLEAHKQIEGLLIHVKAQKEGMSCACYRCTLQRKEEAFLAQKPREPA